MDGGAWHRLRRCSRLKLPHSLHRLHGRHRTCRSGLASRWAAKQPRQFVHLCANPGAAAQPIATQGRSYKASVLATRDMQDSCSHKYSVSRLPARSLWERASPRRSQRGAWHRLRRCSRACPLPQMIASSLRAVMTLWERVPPRRNQGGACQRLRQCSRNLWPCGQIQPVPPAISRATQHLNASATGEGCIAPDCASTTFCGATSSSKGRHNSGVPS